MKKQLLAAAAGLALIFGGALAIPIPSAEAASCKTVVDGDARGLIGQSYYSINLSWSHSPIGSQSYIVEKSTDAGANWTVVQSSTLTSYSTGTVFGLISPDLRFRLSTANCDTAGVVFTYDPPAPPPTGTLFFNTDIY